MRDFNRDVEFNKIGRCWLIWLTEPKKLLDQIRKDYDEDQYLMYDHIKYVKTRLNKMNDVIIKDDIQKQFVEFSRELIQELETMAYSKEINEKYNR